MMNLPAALMLACLAVAVHASETDWSRPADTASVVQALAASQDAAPSPKAAPAPIVQMKAETAEFLRSIGLDPESEDAQVAHQDGTISSIFRGKPISHSLESLAKEGSKKGVTSFITTRVFIRKLKADFAGTPIPKVGYDGIYLTNDERLLVADKLVEGFSPK